MHTATDALQEQTQKARAVAVAVPKTARLAYLDTLRVILIILVIALHTAITYGALGDWTYVDPAQNEMTGILLTLVTGSVQAFALGLFFFVSGYFTPGAYDRKGLARFWKDRLLRLGIPMLVYTFALSRVPQYVAAVARRDEARTFWEYARQTWITQADEGPTWFLFALLLFSGGYTLWRLAARSQAAPGLARSRSGKVPGRSAILGFGLLVAVLMFVIGLWSPVNETVEVLGIFNLMTIFFGQYIPFFVAGILAYRNDWLSRFDSSDLRFWAWLTLGMWIMMPVMFVAGGAVDGGADRFLGGPYWQSAAFLLWVGLFSVSISMALILWLRGRQFPTSRLASFAGPNAYSVYLIHALVLVPVSIAFSGLPLPPLLKFAIVLPLVVTLSFLLSEALRRIPGLKSIL